MSVARAAGLALLTAPVLAASADEDLGRKVFTQIAQPQLAAKCAGPCHDGGNPNARNAVDMSLLADTVNPMSQQTACNEILTRVNKLDIPNSGILLAPDPNSGTGHPFKDPDFVNFRDNAIIPWATMERDAP